MDDLDSIYNDFIMEHSMNSYNKKELNDANYSEHGHNPSCGDDITLQVKVNNGIIEDMAFTGHGCAISQASTSVMIDTLKGKTIDEAKVIISKFLGMIDREITDDNELEILEDAIAFKNISNMPARVKCAILAWRTLEKIINEKLDNGIMEENIKNNHCDCE
jgi:nitrogen fixation NifU-like protein